MYEIDQYDLNGDDNESKTAFVPQNILKNIQLRVKSTNFYTVKKVLKSEWIDGKYYDNVTINMYGSGDYGSLIKNAVTGVSTGHRVGSIDEKQYFTVSMSIGLDKNNGPIHLYYDSPSQYEKHQYTILDQDIIENWFERFTPSKN